MALSRHDITTHLRDQYAGVFGRRDLDRKVMRHLEEHVGPTLAAAELAQVREAAPGARSVLDVGCGYGAFVMAARQAGLEACGLEVEDVELTWARDRFAEAFPGEAPPFVKGSAMSLPFDDGSFDAVTLWNVLEHVADWRRALHEAARVLRVGGTVFLIAPNYAAFRREAHYGLPWVPLLPRRLARLYLRAAGRDARFFDEAIRYVTNRRVLAELRALGLTARDPRERKLDRRDAVVSAAGRRMVAVASALRVARLMRGPLRASFHNPLRTSIAVEASKADRP